MRGYLASRHLVLILALFVLGSLALPTLVLAGEPVPGAEVFLQQEPPGPVVQPSGGGVELGAYGSVVFPEGAVLANATVNWTVYGYRTPMTATDGGKVSQAVKLEASPSAVFEVPVTITLTIPPSIKPETAAVYEWNPDTDVWERMASSKSATEEGKAAAQATHFSWYGVGGEPPAPTSTPASSPGSLALLALGALGLALTIGKRRAARAS